MYQLPPASQVVALHGNNRPTILAQIIQATDYVTPKANALWIPEWLYDHYMEDSASGHFMTRFIDDYEYVHLCTGLTHIIMAHVTGEPPHDVNYQMWYQRKRSTYCFCKFPLNFKLQVAK